MQATYSLPPRIKFSDRVPILLFYHIYPADSGGKCGELKGSALYGQLVRTVCRSRGRGWEGDWYSGGRCQATSSSGSGEVA